MGTRNTRRGDCDVRMARTPPRGAHPAGLGSPSWQAFCIILERQVSGRSYAFMSQALAFYFVDVFAREPFAGNPLVVVADADALDERTMRAVAREFNQSETTFL